MKDALAPLDRTTLAVWRTTNLIGWPAFALGAALLIHWTAAEYTDRYWPGLNLNFKWEWFTGWGFLPTISFRGAATLLIALAIGAIVGARAIKHQPLLAAGTAAVYSLITILAIAFYAGPVDTFRAGPQQILVTQPRLVHGFGGNGKGGWVYDAVTLATIPLAALWARRVARRRIV